VYELGVSEGEESKWKELVHIVGKGRHFWVCEREREMGLFGLWAIECQRASGTSLYGKFRGWLGRASNSLGEVVLNGAVKEGNTQS
jgi:hypothetical protein